MKAKREMTAAEYCEKWTIDTRWFVADVVHNNHLPQFAVGQEVLVRREGNGFLVASMGKQAGSYAFLSTEAKGKWSLKARRIDGGKLWTPNMLTTAVGSYLDREAAKAVSADVAA